MIFRPSRAYLISSHAEGITALNAFDNALMEVGLANYNFVKVSSIFPPGCKLVDEVDLSSGSVVPCVYASLIGKEEGQRIAAAVSIGIPEDRSKPGVVMEFSETCSCEEAEEQTENMVRYAMERRSLAEYELKSVSAEHRVKSCACVFAALLLLP